MGVYGLERVKEIINYNKSGREGEQRI
jgi:hypothetical protein